MSTFSKNRKGHKEAVARYHQRVRTEKNQLKKQFEKMMEERNKQVEAEKEQTI